MQFTGSLQYTFTSTSSGGFSITGDSSGLGIVNATNPLATQIFHLFNSNQGMAFGNRASADYGSTGQVLYQLGNGSSSGILGFSNDSDGGAASVVLENTSTLNISNSAPLNIGTIVSQNDNGTAITFNSAGGGVVFRGNNHVAGLATIESQISGPGSLEIDLNTNTTTGIALLNGDNSYSEGTTITQGIVNIASAGCLGNGKVSLNGGTLQLGGSSSSLTQPLDLTSNGTIDLNGNTGWSIESSSLTWGPGTELSLQTSVSTPVALSYSPAAVSGTGALNVGADIQVTVNTGSSLGGSANPTSVSLSDSSSSLIASSASTENLYSAISGDGSVQFTNGGTWSVYGTPSYTGTTSVGANTTVSYLGNVSQLGDITLGEGSIVDFDVSTSATYGGTLSGNGSLALNKGETSGTLYLTGANSYFGGTQLYRGILSAVDAAYFGTDPIAFLGGNLQLQGDTTLSQQVVMYSDGLIDPAGNQVTVSGQLTGAATTLSIDAGTLRLTNSSNYLWLGSLQINSGGAVLAATPLNLPNSILLNQGMLSLQPLTAQSFPQVIQGTGIVSSAGPVTLTGASSFSGAIDAVSGTLTFDAVVGGLHAALNIHQGATVDFEVAGSDTFSGTISGAGDLLINQNGSNGTLTLSGTNSFTGSTQVQGGILSVNGALGGRVTVMGGTLKGIGTLGGDVDVASAGAISPGNSIGTLSIVGNYRQSGDYQVEMDGQGNSSFLNIGGTSTFLADSTLILLENAVDLSSTYHILHADGGLLGTFSQVVVQQGFYKPKVLYQSKDIFLTFKPDLSIVTRTYNQHQVALQLESVQNPTGALNTAINTLVFLSEADLLHALDQMSGQHYLNVLLQAELANERFVSDLYNPLRQSVATPGRCFSTPWTFWVQGGWGKTFAEGNSNALGFHADGYEIEAGVQKGFKNWTLGGALGYIYDSLSFKVGGEDRNQNYLGSLYALYRPLSWYTFSELVLGGGSHSIRRPIALSDLHYRLENHLATFQGTYYGELGVDLKARSFLIQPFVDCEAGYYRFSQQRDKGSDPFRIDLHQKSRTSAYSGLGLHLSWQNPRYRSLFIGMDSSCRYRLTSMNTTLKQEFVSFGTPFHIKGFQMQRLSFTVDAYLAFQTLLGQFYLQAEGNFWSRASTHHFLAGFNQKW